MSTTSNLLGLHSLLTLHTLQLEKLMNLVDFASFLNQVLVDLKLEQVGEVLHEFENKSFTATFCLKESHICIHTWPEINTITTDVYLCNYSADNTEKVRVISNSIIRFFEASIVKQIEIER